MNPRHIDSNRHGAGRILKVRYIREHERSGANLGGSGGFED